MRHFSDASSGSIAASGAKLRLHRRRGCDGVRVARRAKPYHYRGDIGAEDIMGVARSGKMSLLMPSPASTKALFDRDLKSTLHWHGVGNPSNKTSFSRRKRPAKQTVFVIFFISAFH